MAIKLVVIPDDDTEIRAYIKDLIRGVVTSLTREEVLEGMVATAARANIEKSYDLVRNNVEQAHRSALEHALRRDYNVLNIRTDAQKMIKEQVDSFITEDMIKAMLRTILEEKVKRMGL